jgi:xanthine dehydrogenase YagT iron-sulfur-binding subunit
MAAIKVLMGSLAVTLLPDRNEAAAFPFLASRAAADDLFAQSSIAASVTAFCIRATELPGFFGIGMVCILSLLVECDSHMTDGHPSPASFPDMVEFALTINGREHRVRVEPRVTLLDLLRERLSLTGTKKGCNFGECGACTVHMDGRRVNACMILAVAAEGREITTIEGLADGGALHPVQQAFIDQDGFQCGFCTPGQVMSAVACIEEGHTRSEAEIREWMSGNLCRCSAYPQIVAAIEAAAQTPKSGAAR